MGNYAFAKLEILTLLNTKLKEKHEKLLIKKHVKIPNELIKYNKCDIKEEKRMEKVIKVEGMMCMHCVAHVKEALESLKGVEKAEVSLDKNEAIITSQKEIKDKDIEKVISKAGYKVVK